MLQHYRSQGYQVAVAIAELRPDFIKLDMSLVKEIQNSTVKQAILEGFVTFAAKIGCKIIAEGIETREELRTLTAMGVDYGQGYFLARPAAPPSPVRDEAGALAARYGGVQRQRLMLSETLDPYVESTVTLPPTTLVREVAEHFTAGEGLEGVVILEGLRPVGTLMRHQLFRLLGVPFGVALYYDRPVSKLMEKFPIAVEVTTPVEQVSRLMTARDHTRRYELVTVTEGGEYRGVLSVHRLLRTLTEAHANRGDERQRAGG